MSHLKNYSIKFSRKILSFESISVVISQKLSELDQFNIGSFFFQPGNSHTKKLLKFWENNPTLYSRNKLDFFFLIEEKNEFFFQLCCELWTKNNSSQNTKNLPNHGVLLFRMRVCVYFYTRSTLRLTLCQIMVDQNDYFWPTFVLKEVM